MRSVAPPPNLANRVGKASLTLASILRLKPLYPPHLSTAYCVTVNEVHLEILNIRSAGASVLRLRMEVING